MNTEGCFKINHPKWSRLDQEARKTSLMSKAAHAAFKDQQSDGLEKVCKRLFKLSFGRDTTRCRHSPNLDRERSAKYHHSSNMAEYNSSHISSLTILWPSHKGQIPSNQTLPLFKDNFLISIFFQIDDFHSDHSFP